MLVATDNLMVLSLLSLLSSTLGDYQGYQNYVYPETYTYPDNTSLASYGHHYHNQPTQRSRRLLDQGLLEMEAGESEREKFSFNLFLDSSSHLDGCQYTNTTHPPPNLTYPRCLKGPLTISNSMTQKQGQVEIMSQFQNS